METPKRPYVLTPRRLAALRANLEKARAAPKEKIYRHTDKRRAANLANLAKAQAVLASQRAQAQAEAPGGPTAGADTRGYSPGKDKARAPAHPAELPDLLQGLKRVFFPPAAEGESPPELDPETDALLMKTARALLRPRQIFRREGRREIHQIMELLTTAAARPEPLTPAEAILLAQQIVKALPLGEAWDRANRVYGKLLELFQQLLESHYGDALGCGFSITAMWEDLEEEYQQIRAMERAEREAKGGGSFGRGRNSKSDSESKTKTPDSSAESSTSGSPESNSQAQGASAEGSGPSANGSDAGPDRKRATTLKLPATFEEFRDLVGLAFRPLPREGWEPSEEEAAAGRLRVRILAETLWDRLKYVPTLARELREAAEEFLQEVIPVPRTGPELYEVARELVILLYPHRNLPLAVEPVDAWIRDQLGELLEARYGFHVSVEFFREPCFRSQESSSAGHRGDDDE